MRAHLADRFDPHSNRFQSTGRVANTPPATGSLRNLQRTAKRPSGGEQRQYASPPTSFSLPASFFCIQLAPDRLYRTGCTCLAPPNVSTNQVR
jgi:hypothetical protein